MRKLILAVVVWMGGNCALAQDLDEIIYRGLDDIRHELFLQRLEGGGSYSGARRWTVLPVSRVLHAAHVLSEQESDSSVE